MYKINLMYAMYAIIRFLFCRKILKNAKILDDSQRRNYVYKFK